MISNAKPGDLVHWITHYEDLLNKQISSTENDINTKKKQYNLMAFISIILTLFTIGSDSLGYQLLEKITGSDIEFFGVPVYFYIPVILSITLLINAIRFSSKVKKVKHFLKLTMLKTPFHLENMFCGYIYYELQKRFGKDMENYNKTYEFYRDFPKVITFYSSGFSIFLKNMLDKNLEKFNNTELLYFCENLILLQMEYKHIVNRFKNDMYGGVTYTMKINKNTYFYLFRRASFLYDFYQLPDIYKDILKQINNEKEQILMIKKETESLNS